MKPLGTDSDVENGLTTPKSSFEKTISPSCFSASESVSETENLAKNTRTLGLNIFVLAAFFSLATNALLRCEARNTEAAAYHLNH
ncbi:hypothetical protein [Vibrio diabolicus]|uniref:hypothetical protein n=1 Tax=Vibrio diabolicus TaxID=50719 RepID=UPI0035A6B8A7